MHNKLKKFLVWLVKQNIVITAIDNKLYFLRGTWAKDGSELDVEDQFIVSPSTPLGNKYPAWVKEINRELDNEHIILEWSDNYISFTFPRFGVRSSRVHRIPKYNEKTWKTIIMDDMTWTPNDLQKDIN